MLLFPLSIAVTMLTLPLWLSAFIWPLPPPDPIIPTAFRFPSLVPATPLQGLAFREEWSWTSSRMTGQLFKSVSHNIGESYIIWPYPVWVSRSHMIKPLLTFLSFWILSFMLCCGRSDISNPFSAGQLLLHVAAKQTNRTLTPWAANLLCLVSPYQQMQPDLTPCFFHCYSIVSIPTHYPDFCLYKLVLLECSTDPQLLHFASHL